MKPLAVHSVTIPSNKPFRLALFSDLHIGSSLFDQEKCRHDLQQAVKQGCRLLFNGDVLDAIITRDYRFHPEATANSLMNTSDMLGSLVDSAYEFLLPFASSIDLIGMGNHEYKVCKQYNIDIIRMLVEKLRTTNSGIIYGGYSGFLHYRVRNHRNRPVTVLTIYYHHGAETSGFINVGLIQRLRANYDADVYWLGHLHHQFIYSGCRHMSTENGQIVEKTCHFVRSGSYLRPYSVHSPVGYSNSRSKNKENGTVSSSRFYSGIDGYQVRYGLLPTHIGYIVVDVNPITGKISVSSV